MLHPRLCLTSIVMLLTAAGAHAQATHAATTTTAPVTITYRGCAKIRDTTTDQHGRDFGIHGASGITFAGEDTYWAVLDTNDKLIRLRVELRPDGSIASASVTAGMTIMDNRDNEGIAFNPRVGSAFVSEEQTPGISEYSLIDGRRLMTLVTPEIYLHGNVVRNRGFESLSLSPDGKSLWTSNEHALRVDGSPLTQAEPMGSTSRVRLLRYAIDADGKPAPAEQFVYQTAGVHEIAGFNSLTDLVALPDGRLLALERSAGENLKREKSIKTRIFLVTINGATDVSRPPFGAGLPPVGEPSPAPLQFVHKDLLLEGMFCEPSGQNIEGLCLGPRLGEDRFALLGVVDDTDGELHLSHTQIVAFELALPDAGKAR